MRCSIEYVVNVGAYEWGVRSVLEEALELYEDAKENNSDVFVTLSKVTTETIKSEFIETEDVE